MKKIIGVIGSLRKDSIHRILFNEYKELSKDCFELIEGKIGDFPLYNQDLDGQCQSVSELGNLIKESKGIIFFAPEYNYSLSGVLKNAIDWLSREKNSPFDNKPAAIIGGSPGKLGTARMQYHLRQIGVFLNLHFLNKPEVMINGAFDKIKDGKISDEASIDFLKKHIQKFNDFVH